MSKLKSAECIRSLPNSKWLHGMLEYFNLEARDIEQDILSNILNRCFTTAEGKPIYLTDSEWDVLYTYLLKANRDPDSAFEGWMEALEYCMEEEPDLKAKWALEHSSYEWWMRSLKEYMYLFEKDISFLETNKPDETFRCVGCNKKLAMYYMNVVVPLSEDQDGEMLEKDQETLENILIEQISLLKTLIYDPDWILHTSDNWNDKEKILMLLRNARRILDMADLKAYFDPYSVRILYDVVKSYEDDKKIGYYAKRLMKILYENISGQMQEPLCRSCNNEDTGMVY